MPASGQKTVTPVRGLAPDELPGNRAPAAVARQQRRMEADGRPARELEQRLGHDLGDVGEDGQVGIRSLERLRAPPES